MLVDAQKAEEGSQTILYPRSFYLSLPKAVLKDKTTISTEAHTTNSAVWPVPYACSTGHNTELVVCASVHNCGLALKETE